MSQDAPPPGLTLLADGSLVLQLHVVPRSSRTRMTGVQGDRIKLQLAAAPVDGAANAALVEFLAKALGVRKADVELVRGETSKHKTVQVRGVSVADAIARLGLPCAGTGATLLSVLLLTASMACEVQTSTVALSLMLPEDDLRFESTNNVSVVLEPDGWVDTFATDGLDFELSTQLDPDGTTRTLSIYLARGETLLGWGRSAPFTYAAAADAGFEIAVGVPDRLVAMPIETELLPPVLAAYAPDYGIIAIGSDGNAVYLDERTLALRGAAPLADAPPATDGLLVGDALGGVQRIAWDAALTSHRFDVATNTWARLELVGASDHGDREGAASTVDAGRRAVRIFGGGTHADVVDLSLMPTGGEPAVRPVGDLDGPRRGATAVRVDRSDDAVHLVVGGDDPALPLVFELEARRAAGIAGAWTGASCLPRTTEDAAAWSVLCLGGLRDGIATADALRINGGETLEVEVLSDWLPAPMAEPLLFQSASAFFAQDAGSWLRIDPTQMSVEDTGIAHPRVHGGVTVDWSTGATFLVGAVATQEQPISQWHAFVPGFS